MQHPRRPERPAAITVLAALDLVIAAVAASSAVYVATLSGEEPLLVLLSAACVAAAVLHVACAWGVLRLRPWGRLLQVGLAILGLFGVPIGTLVSVLMLVYLLHPGTELLFSGRDPASFTDEERTSVERVTRSGSFTVIAIVGVLSMTLFAALVGAVAVPEILARVQRRAQQQTMADLRALGAAIESYAVDHDRYPSAASLEELRAALEPTYSSLLPRRDSWGHDLRAVSWWDENLSPADGGYAVASCGRDGEWELASPREYAGGVTSSWDADIVYESGQFLQYPEGDQE